MTHRASLLFGLVMAAVLALSPVLRAGDAREFKAGDLTIRHAWSRPTDRMAKTGAIYLTIANEGTSADRLLTASTPAAAIAQLHTTVNKDGMLSMQHLAAIDIPAKSTTTLKPGVFHVMLMQLKAPLAVGAHFPLELGFEKAGKVTLEVSVEQPSADGGGMKMDMGHDGAGMKH